MVLLAIAINIDRGIVGMGKTDNASFLFAMMITKDYLVIICTKSS